MTELTKEELEAIYVHMENEPIELMNKVKTMIDNYCENYIPKHGNNSKILLTGTFVDRIDFDE